MKKLIQKIFFMASVGFLGYAIFNVFGNSNALAALRLEAQRYNSVNTDYLVFGFFFLVGSFLSGWLWSKIKQV